MTWFAGYHRLPSMSLALLLAAAAGASAESPATGSTGTLVTRPASSTEHVTPQSRTTGTLATRPTGSVAARPQSSATGTITSRQTGSAATAHPKSGMTGTLTSAVSNTVTSTLTSTATATAVVSLPARSAVHTPPGTLSPYAEELARTIHFDRRVLLLMKEETGERIQRLVGYDADGYQIMANGVAVPVPEEKTDAVLERLRKKLVPEKYLPFVTEINSGLKMDKIGVLRTTDQYEILRVMQTNGDDADVSNQDIIEQLQEWEKSNAFEIVGADNDWVEIEFRTLPKDLKSFVREVYDFSPDAVDEGPGSVEELLKELKKTNRLFLLWE